jgi:hypothetical protein
MNTIIKYHISRNEGFFYQQSSYTGFARKILDHGVSLQKTIFEPVRDYKGKDHLITGHEGPTGGVEV